MHNQAMNQTGATPGFYEGQWYYGARWLSPR